VFQGGLPGLQKVLLASEAPPLFEVLVVETDAAFDAGEVHMFPGRSCSPVPAKARRHNDHRPKDGMPYNLALIDQLPPSM
jgi:hypothetical protein